MELEGKESEYVVSEVRGRLGYKLVVFGYRFLAIGFGFFLVLVIAMAAFDQIRVKMLFLLAFSFVGLGVLLLWAGMARLYLNGLMPRGGTLRHRALMKELRNDVVPFRRNRS